MSTGKLGANSLASLGAGIAGLFNNPGDSALNYLDKFQGQVTPWFNPYIDAGKLALPQLQEQYGNLINNPTAMMNQIGSSYKASPGYQWQVNQATNAANRAGAASGMAGSPMEQQKLAQTVTGLANQDYYNYMNQGLNQYQQGLAGLSGLAGYGLNAGTSLADVLQRNAQAQSQAAYAGTANDDMGIGSLIGGIGAIASFF